MQAEEILPEQDTSEQDIPLPAEATQTPEENLLLQAKEIESKENTQPLSSPTKRRFYAGTMTLRFKDDENARLFR